MSVSLELEIEKFTVDKRHNVFLNSVFLYTTTVSLGIEMLQTGVN